jgi:hypothetical protein
LKTHTISDALEWLNKTKESLSISEKWVVMRDGKSFGNDGMHELLKSLGSKVTYVEVIKDPVPFITDANKPAAPGGLAILEGGQEAILQTESPLIRHQIGRPIRLRIKYNPAGRSIESIATAVFSLCHSPTLGLRTTRIPAPTYWADGLAKESGKSIQFGGLHHIPHGIS